MNQSDATVSMPASSNQQQFWILDSLTGDSPAYVIPMALTLTGPIDVDALAWAIQALAARHDALRMSFATSSGGLHVTIHDHVAIQLLVKDVKGSSPSAIGRHWRRTAGCFDLQRPPLIRFELLRFETYHAVLLMHIHHIIADGWSLCLLLGDLADLYNARVTGTPIRPWDGATFQEFSRVQAGSLANDGESAAGLDYWATVLAPLQGMPPTQIPTDRPRNRAVRHSGRTLHIDLPTDVAAGVRAAALEAGTSAFAVLLANLAGVMRRHLADDLVVLGVPVANRLEPRFERTVGPVANTAIIPLHIELVQNLSEIIEATSAILFDSLPHQDVPLLAIRDRLPRLFASQLPYTILCNQQAGDPLADVHFANLTVRPFTIETETTRMDLAWELDCQDQRIHLAVEYDTDLFDMATIQLLIDNYVSMLKHSKTGSSASLSHLRLAHQAAVRGPRKSLGRSYMSEIIEHIRAQPERIAIRHGTTEVSYAELAGQVGRMVRALAGHGVTEHTRVAVWAARRPDTLAAIISVLACGGCVVPIDANLPDERIRAMLADCRPGVIVHDGRTVDPHIAAIHMVDVTEGEVPVAQWNLRNGKLTAYIMYTSGSTGRPNAVVVSDAALNNSLQAIGDTVRFTADDVMLAQTTFSFDPSLVELILPLMRGGIIELVPTGAEGAIAAAGLVRDRKLSVIQATPTWWSLFASLLDSKPPGLRGLVGGETVTEPMAAIIRSLTSRSWNVYGPTEATIWCTAMEIPDDSAPPIGAPLANIECYILGGADEVVPPGVPGELCIAGESLAEGYWERASLTAQRFVTNRHCRDYPRIYRTGDLAKLDAHGNLWHLGRLDRQLKLGGMRVEPAEIEQVLQDYPGISAAVAGLSTGSEPRLIATIERRGGGSQTAQIEEIAAYLRKRLPSQMIPSWFDFVDKLPTTANGKIDRATVLADATTRLASQGNLQHGWHSAPSSIEAQVTRVCCDGLKVNSLQREQDLYLAGATSLTLLQIRSALSDRFGVKIPLAQIFANPTVAGISRLVADRSLPPVTGDGTAGASAQAVEADCEVVSDPVVTQRYTMV